MGELAGWPYWKVVSITGQSGAGTDYQVELEIGDSAGGDFHLEGHCTNFPQDIRITDDDGTTLLDHWVEDITADPIVMHVEVKDDLGSNQTIRVYYGKSGETSDSNGAATFIDYHSAASAQFLDLFDSPSGALIYEGRVKATAATHTLKWGLARTQHGGDDSAEYIISYTGNNNRYIRTNEGVGQSDKSETPSFTQNIYYRLKIINTGSAVTGFVDDNQIGTGDITTDLPLTDMGIFMRVETGTGAQDWSFVRKYNSPEPAFSSAGAEQTPTVGAIMNQFQRANIGADLYNGVFA